MIHLGDITKIKGDNISPVDVITFGSPCQDLSIAGKRAGLSGERSGLFMEAVRIIKEMRQATNGEYPKYAVWENVPGAFSSNKGEDFRAVLEELARIKETGISIPAPDKSKWAKSGFIDGDDWSIAWRTMDAQYWGVPQRRLRISLVLDLTGGRAGEILFEPESLRGHFAPCITPWQGAAGSAEESVGASSLCLNDQGGQRMDVTEDFTATLRAASNHPPLVHPPLVFENHSQDTRYKGPLAVAPTVSSTYGMGGNNQPFVLETPKTMKIRSGCEGDGKGALLARDYNGPGMADSFGRVIAQPVGADLYNGTLTGDKAVTLTTAAGQGGANTGPSVIEKITRWIVRRMTPTECERLQGYPDGWTDLGDWVDSKGKAHKAADTPRYKALGNSIALPQWYYVLGGIADRLPDNATLGSLFDGIGGFPYVWAQLHAGHKELCVWASEIEEFPIAVTKKWFNGK